MKAKRLVLLAAILLALGCSDDWNPVGTAVPITNNGGGPECNERLYPGMQQPPHCEPPAEAQQ